MAGEPVVTVTGSITEPDFRFTPSGKAVLSFRLATTPRVKDAAGNYEDGETTWFKVTVWGRDAENASETLNKGDRVVVLGRLSTGKPYTTRDGEERPGGLEIQADEIGVSLKFATATVSRNKRG